MLTHFKHTVILTLSVLLFNCASQQQVNQSNEAKSATPQQSEVEELTEFETTRLQTSNGEIVIEPTVVSTTDQVVDTNETEAYNDPLEFINRPLFAFNHFTYKYAFIPLAKGYNAILPEPVQNSVSNAFSNIVEPLNFVNNTISGDFSEAGTNIGRFLINSTIGLLGLFDPATHWFDIEKKPQSFSQTLAGYGVGSGPYIVVPLLGQSDVRGTTSIMTESLIHPTQYIFSSPDDVVARALDGFNDFTTQADIYEVLYEKADDPYIYFRNQYIQSRNRNDLAEQEQSEVNIVGEKNRSKQAQE